MGEQMLKILLVEDSSFFGEMVLRTLQEEYGFSVVWAKSLAETTELLDQSHGFSAAILDYNLPDAPNGEVIPLVVKKGVPAIVFTASVNEEVRKAVWANKVVDYVLKENAGSLGYIAELVRRLERNTETHVLVVDDSAVFRQIIAGLLKVHGYQIHMAANGQEALDEFKSHPTIKLVVVDYNMPEMNGVELTAILRRQFGTEDLAIIGMSGQGKGVMAATFMKSGANDFIIKQSFLTEEFYCRVNQNIDYIDHLKQIREAAIRDFLTGLYNRRYFFDVGAKLFASAERDIVNLSCAMIDIDFFKKVNDKHGHEAGDLVLVAVADLMNKRMRETDLVARLGGEEFCILTTNKGPGQAVAVFEDIRRQIEALQVNIDDGQSLSVTISLGVTSTLDGSLEDMVKRADELLYQAKEEGRNRVIIDQ